MWWKKDKVDESDKALTSIKTMVYFMSSGKDIVSEFFRITKKGTRTFKLGYPIKGSEIIVYLNGLRALDKEYVFDCENETVSLLDAEGVSNVGIRYLASSDFSNKLRTDLFGDPQKAYGFIELSTDISSLSKKNKFLGAAML